MFAFHGTEPNLGCSLSLMPGRATRVEGQWLRLESSSPCISPAILKHSLIQLTHQKGAQLLGLKEPDSRRGAQAP